MTEMRAFSRPNRHLGPNEATWELEDVMREAYLFLFNFDNTKEGNAIPPFDP